MKKYKKIKHLENLCAKMSKIYLECQIYQRKRGILKIKVCYYIENIQNRKGNVKISNIVMSKI